MGIILLLPLHPARGDPVFDDPVYKSFVDMPFLTEPGDFNSDGIPDFIVAPYNNSFIVTFLGLGDGFFVPTTTSIRFATGSMSVCEINSDDTPDLLIGNGRGEYVCDSVLVLLGDGSGSFVESSVLYQENSFITSGDLDGDGDSDLIITNVIDKEISVRKCNDDGTFESGVSYYVEAGIGHTATLVGDLNGDDHPDLAFPLSYVCGYVLGTMYGNGDGTLQPVAYHHYYGGGGGGSGFCYAVAGDFNEDSLLDISSSSGMVIANVCHFIFLNDGADGFNAIDSLGMCNAWQVVQDFNMDGHLDIGTSSGSYYIYPGVGDGHFLTSTGDLLFYFLGSTGQIASEDFDGDGDPDLIRLDVDADTVYVYLNNTVPQGIEGEEYSAPINLRFSSNPFSSSLSITYSLPEPAQVELSVYDLMGRLVENLKSDSAPAGEHTSVWAPDPEFPNGCYLVVLDAFGERIVRKCVKL
jgi:hypothetical protein